MWATILPIILIWLKFLHSYSSNYAKTIVSLYSLLVWFYGEKTQSGASNVGGGGVTFRICNSSPQVDKNPLAI